MTDLAQPVAAWLYEWSPHKFEQWAWAVDLKNPTGCAGLRFRNVTALYARAPVANPAPVSAVEDLRKEWKRVRDEKRGLDYHYSKWLRDLADRTLTALLAAPPAQEPSSAEGEDALLEAFKTWRSGRWNDGQVAHPFAAFKAGHEAALEAEEPASAPTDPICRQCASGEPGIPEHCTCEIAARLSPAGG